MEKWPLGVFTSIDAGLGVKLEVAYELGVPTIQIHAPHKSTRTQQQADRFLARLKEYDITLTAVFGGFEGESYADIPTTQKTVGLVPPETRAARTAEMKEIADFARVLGCDVVALHLGFIPHEHADPLYRGAVEVTQEICEHCQQLRQALHLETGQESADDLLKFIGDVNRKNLAVNFDPANMILYGSGEPIAAVRRLGGYIRSVHCKDGRWSDEPGKTFGQEVPLGEGDVGMDKYLRALDEIGYVGPLTIEREIPQEPERQKTEISHALWLLGDIKAQLAR